MGTAASDLLPIGIVTNVHSGRNRRGRYGADRLRALLAGRGLVGESRHPEQLDNILERFLGAGVRVIAVNGGDGTWGMLLDRLLQRLPAERLPALLPMRGGTMNMVANAAGTKGNPASVLRRFLDGSGGMGKRPTVVVQKTLRVSVAGEPGRRHGFVWATGMAYSFLKRYYENAESSPGNAFWTTVTLIAGAPIPLQRFRSAWRTIRAKVTVDGTVVADGQVRIAVAAVFAKLVLWFAPFGAGVGPPEEGFGFMLNRMPSFGQVLPRLWSLSRGSYQHPDLHRCFAARRVVFETSSGWLLDGEMYHPRGVQDVEISSGPVIRLVKV